MNKYMKLKRKHQKEINEFPTMFAFNMEQFNEGMKKLGVTDKTELISIGYGGYIRKTDGETYVRMHKRMDEECAEAMKDPEYCYQMFRCELANHEYCISGDFEDTLNACGLTEDEVMENPMLLEALRKAEWDYLDSVEW